MGGSDRAMTERHRLSVLALEYLDEAARLGCAEAVAEAELLRILRATSRDSVLLAEVARISAAGQPRTACATVARRHTSTPKEAQSLAHRLRRQLKRTKRTPGALS
jgi:hypothetical protein